MDFGAELLAILTGVIVKLTVMAVAGWLVVRVYGAGRAKPPRRLWLLIPDEDRREARLLTAALALFCVSELTCGVEVYVLGHSSPILSAIHAITSTTGMALFALGIYRFFDGKLLRFGGPRCLGNRICRGCTVDKPEGCKFRVVLLLAATFVALAALAPLFASTAPMLAEPARWALPFPTWNRWWDVTAVPWLRGHVPHYQPSGVAFVLLRSMFVLELRVIPLVAFAVAIAAIVVGVRGRVRPASELLVVAAGILAYAYFELVLYRGTGDALAGALGHEVAELWFLLFTAELLRRSFPTRATG